MNSGNLTPVFEVTMLFYLSPEGLLVSLLEFSSIWLKNLKIEAFTGNGELKKSTRTVSTLHTTDGKQASL